jgi:hypothetical protein
LLAHYLDGRPAMRFPFLSVPCGPVRYRSNL